MRFAEPRFIARPRLGGSNGVTVRFGQVYNSGFGGAISLSGASPHQVARHESLVTLLETRQDQQDRPLTSHFSHFHAFARLQDRDFRFAFSQAGKLFWVTA